MVDTANVSPKVVRDHKVIILTDSAADVPPEMIADLGIEVVDLSVTIGGKTYVGNEITPEELLRQMQTSGEIAKTSLPAPGVFIKAYEAALEKADTVISVHVSSKLSGTYNAACQAAKDFGDRIHVFDSKALSMSEGLQVVEAARLAKTGATADEVMRKLEWVRHNVRQLTGFDSLEYLFKGGRIGKVGAFVGAILNLKVSITVDKNGEFAPVMKSRGDKAAVRDTVKWVAKQLGDYKRAVFAIGYLFNLERAEALKAALEENFDAVEIYIYEAGPAISTHTGPGWGVAFFPVE